MLKPLIFLLLCHMSISLYGQSGTATDNDRLLLACKDKNHAQMEVLIRQGADVNYIKRPDLELSPLVVSALMNDSTGVAILLAHNANIKILDNAPLSSACMFGYPKIIRLLLEHGAPLTGSDLPEAYHTLVLKAPEVFKWILLGGLLTPLEVENLSFPNIDDDNDIIKLSILEDDRRYLESIEILVEHKLPKDKIDADRNTALDLAIENKNIPFIQKLVSLGFRTSLKGFNDIDLACLSAAQGNLALTRELLGKSPALLNRKSGSGNYLITESFKSKNKELVELLLAKGSSLQVKDSTGNGLLHYAVSWGEPKYFKAVMPELLASANEKNNQGQSPLYLAALHGRKDFFIEMAASGIFTGSNFELLVHDMITRHKLEKAPLLNDQEWYILRYLDQKQLLNPGELKHETTLERAVRELTPADNNLQLIKLLVDREYDVTELNRLLPLFVEKYELDFIQQLLGKNVNQGQLMNLAVKDKKLPLIQWLLASKSNDAERDSTFSSALELAVRSGENDISRILLESKIKPDRKNPYGFTPLDYAIQANDAVTARQLINFGARLDDTRLDAGILANLRTNGNSSMQKIFGLMTLKKQLIADLVATGQESCLDSPTAAADLATFEKNMSLQLLPLKISIDQEPRFWDWFPYKAIGNGGKYSRMGYFSHEQRAEQVYPVVKGSAAKQVSFDVSIDDLGTLPVFNFGQYGHTSAPRELKTILKAGNTVPVCTWDPDRPLSYPLVKISNSEAYSNQPVMVEQQGKNTILVLPGEEAFFDRSQGELKLSYNSSTTDAIHVLFDITYNIGDKVNLSQAKDLGSRLQTYAQLNEIHDRIASGTLSSSELQSAKTLVYVTSLTAVAREYRKAAESELSSGLGSLNMIEGQISKLYNLMFSTNSMASKDPIIATVKQIIQDGQLPDQDLVAFQQFEQNVHGAGNELQLSSTISDFLKMEIFKGIEDKIFEVQLLMLEIAQYMCPTELDKKIAEVRATLTNKQIINPAKLIVQPADLEGRGLKIINALKN